jgi:hypothetical protein
MRVARYSLGGFLGKPGNYHLEMEVVSDTGCVGCRQGARVPNSRLRRLREMETLSKCVLDFICFSLSRTRPAEDWHKRAHTRSKAEPHPCKRPVTGVTGDMKRRFTSAISAFIGWLEAFWLRHKSILCRVPQLPVPPSNRRLCRVRDAH